MTRAAEPNIQDVFLNDVRHEKLTHAVRMMDGSELEQIAAIGTPMPVANDFPQ
jgi:hypothetical protein